MDNLKIWFDAFFPSNAIAFRIGNEPVNGKMFVLLMFVMIAGFCAISWVATQALLPVLSVIAEADIISPALAATDISNLSSAIVVEPNVISDAAQASTYIPPETVDLTTQVSEVTQQASATADIITQEEYSEILADYKAGNLNYSFG